MSLFYSAGLGGTAIPDISDAQFLQSFDVSPEDSLPMSITFNSDGLRMYVVGDSNDNVYQYDLTTNFDISTATFDSSFDVSSEDSGPQSVTFDDTGSRMYVVGDSNDNVYQYGLTTNFDISTATFDSSFDVSSEDSYINSVTFDDTGSRMYVVGSGNGSVYEYSLGTAFDISTATFDSSFDVSSESPGPEGVTIDDTGSRMHVVGLDTDDVYQYGLTTNFDISTATFDSSFDVSAQDSLPTGIAFDSDASDMYVVGRGGDSVYQYTL